VAVILTQLPPGQAAATLERLPAELATLALERLAWLATPSPESLADLGRELREQLGPNSRSAAAQSESLDRLSAVLSAMPGGQRQQVLINLAARNAGLVGRLGVATPTAPPLFAADFQRYHIETPAPGAEEPLIEFDQLPQLDDEALRQVLAAADPQLTLLALTGADERLAGRILRKLPARDAAVLRERLEHPGPVRLRELDEARAELAAIASRLVREGQIELPPSLRFAAAA
jgi:flagellar motor switch protein FliG